MRIPFSLASVIDGSPRAGLAGSTSFTVFKRIAADGSITDLTPPSPVVDDGSGIYHADFLDSLLLAGSTIQYAIRFTQNDANNNPVTQYLTGQVDGGGISVNTGTVVEAFPKGNGFADVRMKVGDTLPMLQQTLRNDQGIPLNLAGGTVKLRMREPGQALKVNASAAVLDAPNGVVRYQWVSGDLDTAGLFDAEWAVTYGTDVETLPANGFVKVLIAPSLA